MMFWTDNNVALIETYDVLSDDSKQPVRFVRWLHYRGVNDLWTWQHNSSRSYASYAYPELEDSEYITTGEISRYYANQPIKIIATILPELMIPKGEEAKYENNR